jgi:thiamine kinase-like enzyme
MTTAETAKRLVETLPGWEVRPGVVPMASPMNQGVDADAFRVVDAAGGRSLWVKLPHADAALFSCPRTVMTATKAAAEAGIGPALHHADPSTGAVVLDDVSATHKVATLNRLAEPAVRDAVLAAKKTMQAGPTLPRRADVFAAIEALLARAREAGIALPEDISWLLDNARAAAAAIAAAGIDRVLAHGDGNASNVLIDPAGGVLLVDMDMAGTMDPFQDLGSFLVEAHAFDPEARESFEVFHGRFDERLFNRARLYGVADDLRWGLIGSILAGTSARTALEFLKYADWRYLRARLAMRDPRFEERLRRL